MPLILNVKIILIGPVHQLHRKQSIWISQAGLATPLPDLCCHWSLLRHCNHHSIIIQCSVLSFKTYFKLPQLCWISSKQYLYLQEELSPSYLHLQESFDQAMAYQWGKIMTKGHRYNPCSHHPQYIFFFSPHNYAGLPKGILDLQPKVNMCVSSSHELTSPSKFLDKMPSGTPRESSLVNLVFCCFPT